MKWQNRIAQGFSPGYVDQLPCALLVHRSFGNGGEGGKGRPNEIRCVSIGSRTDRGVKAIRSAGRLTGAVETFKDKLVIRS